MKVMVLVKASKDSEAGVMPDEKLLTAMASSTKSWLSRHHARGRRASSQLQRSAGEVLGSKAHGDKGPFPEGNQLVAGFWLWNVKSMDEGGRVAQEMPQPLAR
jgi:hypothetical protein